MCVEASIIGDMFPQATIIINWTLYGATELVSPEKKCINKILLWAC